MPTLLNRNVIVQARTPVSSNGTNGGQPGSGETVPSTTDLDKQSVPVIPEKKARQVRPRKTKKNETGNIPVQQQHPQLREIEKMEEEILQRGRRSPGPCPCNCCPAIKRRKPWQKGAAPFVITRDTGIHEKCCCAGCKTLFIEKPPVNDLIVFREECDYISGTKSGQVTAKARKRRYCLSVACVKQRHPNFTPKIPIMDLSVTFTHDEQLQILQFRAGV